MSNELDSILVERKESYGSYKENVNAIADIMRNLNMVHKDKTGEDLNLIDFTNLNYQVIKLVRLAATPSHKDSWQDIQGYGKLAEEYYHDSK